MKDIIAQIDAEIAALQKARAVLAGPKEPKRRRFSAAALERIAAAQRKRWARAKAKSK